MAVGLLIITHDHIGEALLETACHMIEHDPLTIQLLSVGGESDPEAIFKVAVQYLAEVNQGEGVLVLTDLFGSTPSNIAHRLKTKNNVNIVTGINLSMLVRLFNYPELSLNEMTEKACSGGVDGITSALGTEQ